jgi:hypothetical protein
MANKLEVPILGIVENMSYVDLPDGTRHEIFGPSQGQRLVGLSGAPLLGRLPIDPLITTLSDEGHIEEYDSEPYQTLAQNFLTRLREREEARPVLPIISSRSLSGAARPLPGKAEAAATPATTPESRQEEPSRTAPGDRGGGLQRLGRFLKSDR